MGEAAIVAAMSTAVSTIQSQAAARAQQREQQAAANRQIQAQRMQQERREKDMRENAKREQATARASFGARGVSSTAGSSNALLQGISAQTEQSIADDRKLLDFSIENLRENQRAQQRRNLLQTRNSILNTVVGTAGKAFSGSASTSGSGNAD